MGTRNLTKVIDRQGVVRVAQYGQFDGYPSGQGVNALVHAFNHEAIEAGLKRVRWATDEELNAIAEQFPMRHRLGHDDDRNFRLLYPNLTRETAANILGVISWSVGEVILVDNSEFADDEMCEGIYTIDFERMMFISEYGGDTLEFGLNDLPFQNEYRDAWANLVRY